MDRLTRRGAHNGLAGFWVKEINGTESFMSWKSDCYEGIAKLAHYEDLEEQGRLIEQKRGKWEECDWVFYDGHDECVHIPKEAFVCTNCRHAFKKGKLEIRNYCPHCGAKMESEVAE